MISRGMILYLCYLSCFLFCCSSLAFSSFSLQIIEAEQRKYSSTEGDMHSQGSVLRGVAALEILAPLPHNLPVRIAGETISLFILENLDLPITRILMVA